MGHSSEPVLCAKLNTSLPQGAAAPNGDEEESLLTIEIEDGDFDEGDVSVAFPPQRPAACRADLSLHKEKQVAHLCRPLPHCAPPQDVPEVRASFPRALCLPSCARAGDV